MISIGFNKFPLLTCWGHWKEQHIKWLDRAIHRSLPAGLSSWLYHGVVAQLRSWSELPLSPLSFCSPWLVAVNQSPSFSCLLHLGCKMLCKRLLWSLFSTAVFCPSTGLSNILMQIPGNLQSDLQSLLTVAHRGYFVFPSFLLQCLALD